MKHMDEGLLQAWLDGARAGLSDEERAAVEDHVAQCPTCAGRLEALRATSDRTGELLAIADDMDDEIPAFDAVVRRAEELAGEGEGPLPARPGVRPLWGRRTAWAASIAIALGAGWLANDWSAGTPEAVLAPVQVTEAPAVPSVAAGSEADGAAFQESLERQEEDRASAATAARLAPEEEVSADAPGVPAVLADAGAGLPDSAGEPTVAEARAAMAEVAENALTSDRMAAAPAESARTGSPVQPDTGRLLPLPAERDPVARITGATPAPPRPQMGTTVPLTLGDPRWEAASRAAAEERVPFPVEIVGGLAVTAVYVGVFEGVTVVRVAQELEDGRPVVLIQSGEPVAFSSDETRPSVGGTGTEGTHLTLWADLPQDSLRVLLDRVGAR